MKRNCLAAAVALLTILPLCASAAELTEIKTVYMLPMSNGLDQYLASQLTTGSVLKVVTDPRQADAIFTDYLGESFEQRLADLYDEKAKSAASSADNGDTSNTFAKSGMQGQRGRGNVFLVDRKSRAVVWSNYEQPGYPTPDSMKHAASHIAKKLASALKPKAK